MLAKALELMEVLSASPDGKSFNATFEYFKVKHLPDQRRLEWLEKNVE